MALDYFGSEETLLGFADPCWEAYIQVEAAAVGTAAEKPASGLAQLAVWDHMA